MSGCGKSSFINRVRGLTPDDEVLEDDAGEETLNPMYAAVGVTESTTLRCGYNFPENPLITIWDLPGANTTKFSMTSYVEKMKFNEYHAFIILTKDRFYETDKELVKHIRDLSKPFFFARTQMDSTMENEASDRGLNFNEEEAKEKIRRNCREELDDPDHEIYLISRKSPAYLIFVFFLPQIWFLKFEIEIVIHVTEVWQIRGMVSSFGWGW